MMSATTAPRPAALPRPLAHAAAPIVGLTAAGALLRFATLATQSLWKDEAVTAVRILHPGLGGTLAAIPHSEATPPAYYVLVWLWTRLFGTTEVGLRSLSAAVGTATVVVVYLAARRLTSERGALFGAALVAFNPYLIWYSQEARAYALLAFLCALSFLFYARRALVAWALVSALALATHYFAVFTVVPEAVWLLVGADRARLRQTLAAVATVGLAGLALLPLAIHQGNLGHDGWIAQLSIARRVTDSARFFLAGPGTGLSGAYALAAGVLLIPGLVAGVRREAVRPALAIGAATLLLPLVVSLGGYDFFFHRNVIGALPLLAIVAGAGLAGLRLGTPALVAACAVSLAATLAVDTDTRYQRADWATAARALGPAAAARAIVTPALGDEPLEYYLRRTRPIHGVVRVAEVDALGWRQPSDPPPPAPPGFRAVSAPRRAGAFTLIRYRASAPLPVDRATLAESRVGREHPGVLLSQ